MKAYNDAGFSWLVGSSGSHPIDMTKALKLNTPQTLNPFENLYGDFEADKPRGAEGLRS